MVRIGVRVPLGILWLLTLSTGLTEATAGPVLSSPNGINGLVISEADDTMQAVLRVCINATIKPAPQQANIVWSREQGNLLDIPNWDHTSLREVDGCFWSSLTIMFQLVEPAIGNYTITVTTTAGSSKLTIPLRFTIPLCEIPTIHHGHAYVAGVYGDVNEKTSSDYGVECPTGFKLSTLSHSKCERSPDGKAVYKNIPECQAGPILTSPIGSSGLVVSEDDGTKSAVLSLCINSTIKPAPSSANSVVWSTEASGGMSVFSRVQTSLSSSSNGCYWSNLTVNISSVSGAAGYYTVKVSTGAGSATKRFRLEISVALCALPSIHHGHSQASGLIGSSTSSGPTSSDYEVVCGEGLSVSSSPHSKCERSSDGNSVYKNVPECLAGPVLSSPIGINGLVVSEDDDTKSAVLSVCINSTIKPAPQKANIVWSREQGSPIDIPHQEQTSLSAVNGCFLSSLTFWFHLIDEATGNYTITVTTTAGSSKLTIPLRFTIPLCEVPTIHHGHAYATGVFGDVTEKTSSGYGVECPTGFKLSTLSHSKCERSPDGKAIYKNIPECHAGPVLSSPIGSSGLVVSEDDGTKSAVLSVCINSTIKPAPSSANAVVWSTKASGGIGSGKVITSLNDSNGCFWSNLTVDISVVSEAVGDYTIVVTTSVGSSTKIIPLQITVPLCELPTIHHGQSRATGLIGQSSRDGQTQTTTSSDYEVVCADGLIVSTSQHSKCEKVSAGKTSFRNIPDCHAGPVLSSPIGSSGLVVSEDDGTKSAVLSVCINSTIKPAPSSANAVVWSTKASEGIGSVKVITSLNDNNGCFWSNLTVDISVVSEAVGDYTIVVTTSVGSSTKIIPLQITVPLCELPTIHHGQSRATGLIGQSSGDSQTQTTTSSDYEVVCADGLTVSTSKHSKCEKVSAGKTSFRNIPDCHAGPVLSSPIGSSGLVVSEDDGTKSAVLSVCINSTIKPAPSSTNAVVWRTEASGGIGSGKVITSLNDSNGCFWSNLTVDISVVSEAVGDYTIVVTTSVGSSTKIIPLQITVPLCELPTIHHGQSRATGLIGQSSRDGQTQTTTSSDYEVVCADGLTVSTSKHSKCEKVSAGINSFRNIPDCHAGPVLSSPIGSSGLVVSEDDGTKSAVLSVCINSTIKPAPSSANAVVWRTEASGGIGSGKVITSLNDSNGCFWSNLTVDISVVSEAVGDYTIVVTTSVGSSTKIIPLQITVPLCELPTIHHGQSRATGLIGQSSRDGQTQTTTSSDYEVVCADGLTVSTSKHSKCEKVSAGINSFRNIPDCHAGPVSSSPIGSSGLVVSEDDGTKSAVLSVCINSTIKPAPSSANAVVWRTEASGGIGSGKVITSLNDSNGCFWSNLTVDISVVSEAVGDYTIVVTTSVGSSTKIIPLQITVPLCELPTIHHGQSRATGLIGQSSRDGQTQTTTSSDYEVVCADGLTVSTSKHSKCEKVSAGINSFRNIPDCHAGPVLSSPIGSSGLVVSEDDGTKSAVLSVCINSTIKPAPSSANAVVWRTEASGGIGSGKVITSLNDSNGCFWSNLTVDISVVSEAVGDYTIVVTTSVGSSTKIIPLQITVPLCELPTIHHGQSRATGLIGQSSRDGQTQTTTSSDYEVVCADGLTVSTSKHSKCEKVSAGINSFRNIPDCHAGPVLSSPIGSSGLVVSEDDGTKSAVLSVCINSTIKPAPSSATAVVWRTEASGGIGSGKVITSLNDSNGCFWSNLTVDISVVSEAVGDYTIVVTTSVGSSTKIIPLQITVPLCELPTIHHGQSRATGLIGQSSRDGQTQTTTSSDYEVVCADGLTVSTSKHSKCEKVSAGINSFRNIPDCHAGPVLSSPIGSSGLVVSEDDGTKSAVLSVCINSTIKPAPSSANAVVWRTEASGGIGSGKVITSLNDSNGCFWSNLTVDISVVSEAVGDYTIVVTTSVGSSTKIIPLQITVPLCELPTIHHGQSRATGLIGQSSRDGQTQTTTSSDYEVVCADGLTVSTSKHSKCEKVSAGINSFRNIPDCHAGPVLSSPIGSSGLVVSEDDGTKSAVLSVCINSTIKPAPSSANAVVWRTEASGGIGSGKVITSLNDSNGCFWSNLTVDISVVSEAVGDYTIVVTTSVGSSTKIIPLQITVPLCELPTIHHGQSRATGLIGQSSRDGQTQTTTSSDYEVVCADGLTVSTSKHSKCEKVSAGINSFRNIPDCHAGPVLSSPIGSSGLVVSEDDGTKSAVLSVCINSTIKPAPSSANAVVWRTEASGGIGSGKVITSLNDSNGCFWSNLTVDISVVSEAVGDYTIVVTTSVGSSTKIIPLQITVPLCELPTIHHGQSRATGLIGQSSRDGQTQTTTSSDYEVVCADGLTVSTSQHSKCEKVSAGKNSFRNIPDCHAGPVLSSPIGIHGLVISEDDGSMDAVLPVCINSTVKPAPQQDNIVWSQEQGSSIDIPHTKQTSLIDDNGCFWSNLTVHFYVIEPSVGNYTITVTTTAGSSKLTIPLRFTIALCEPPTIHHGQAHTIGVLGDLSATTSSDYGVFCDEGLTVSSVLHSKCERSPDGKAVYKNVPDCHAGPVLSSPIGSSGLVVSEDDGTQSAVLSVCINSTIKPAPTTNSIVWTTASSDAFFAVHTSLHDSNGCFWSNLTVHISVVSEAVGDYTIVVTTSVGSSTKIIPLQITVPLCALPSIHHGHSQVSGLIGPSTSSGPTSSDYKVVCGEGLSVSSSPHSKCERSSDGNSVFKNVPECHAGPVLSSPIGISGLVVSEDDGTKSAVLSVCINSTIKPAPSSANAVVWSTKASGGIGSGKVITSLNDSNGCFWSNLTMDISVVSEAVGDYTVNVTTSVGSTQKTVSLLINVPLCQLPTVHHGRAQASGLIGPSTSSGPTSSDYKVVCGEGLSVSSSPHSKCERSSDGNSVFKNVPECHAGPVLTSPIGSSGLVVSEDDGTKSAVLSVCINSTIKPAPSSANAVVWSTKSSGGIGNGKVITSLHNSNGCFWSNLTVDISVVSEAVGDYTVNVTTSVGSTQKTVSLQINVPLCELPPIHYGHAQPSGLMNNRLSDGQRQTTTSSAYEVVCEHGFRVASLQHSKCELTSGGKAVFANVPDCHAAPVLSSPLEGNGSIVSEDDGSGVAVLSVCINSTIRPPPSSSHAVSWDTDASGWTSVFRDVHTSLNDSNGCFWSNLTVNIGVVAEAVGHYTVKVVTTAGYSKLSIPLHITVPLCELPAIHHGHARPTGVLSNTRSVGHTTQTTQTQTTTSSDYEVVCAEGLSVSSSQHAKCRVAPDGKAMYRDVPDCLALPVLSSPAGKNGLVLSEAQAGNLVTLSVCINSTIKPAPLSSSAINWSTEASGGESVFRYVKTSLVDSHGCFWSNLTVNAAIVSPVEGDYTINVTTSAGSSSQTISLTVAVPTCDVPVIAHGTALGSGVFRDTLRQRSSHYNITCDPGFGLTNYSSMKCLVHVAGKSLFDHTPTCVEDALAVTSSTAVVAILAAVLSVIALLTFAGLLFKKKRGSQKIMSGGNTVSSGLRASASIYSTASKYLGGTPYETRMAMKPRAKHDSTGSSAFLVQDTTVYSMPESFKSVDFLSPSARSHLSTGELFQDYSDSEACYSDDDTALNGGPGDATVAAAAAAATAAAAAADAAVAAASGSGTVGNAAAGKRAGSGSGGGGRDRTIYQCLYGSSMPGPPVLGGYINSSRDRQGTSGAGNAIDTYVDTNELAREEGLYHGIELGKEGREEVCLYNTMVHGEMEPEPTYHVLESGERKKSRPTGPYLNMVPLRAQSSLSSLSSACRDDRMSISSSGNMCSQPQGGEEAIKPESDDWINSNFQQAGLKGEDVYSDAYMQRASVCTNVQDFLYDTEDDLSGDEHPGEGTYQDQYSAAASLRSQDAYSTSASLRNLEAYSTTASLRSQDQYSVTESLGKQERYTDPANLKSQHQYVASRSLKQDAASRRGSRFGKLSSKRKPAPANGEDTAVADVVQESTSWSDFDRAWPANTPNVQASRVCPELRLAGKAENAEKGEIVEQFAEGIYSDISTFQASQDVASTAPGKGDQAARPQQADSGLHATSSARKPLRPSSSTGNRYASRLPELSTNKRGGSLYVKPALDKPTLPPSPPDNRRGRSLYAKSKTGQDSK
ncbi:mucin-3B-like [Sycon ciliatum]|uniref:mucin-3B-like n=1 Tax=Sycon ciliatum TaxID=27933 RepID=UPI0031F601B0